MKLYLLLCLSFVPWSHGHRITRNTPKPLPQNMQHHSQDFPQPNCPPRMRAAPDREEYQKGDKFQDFDWRLSKELNNLETGNIVISPISLKVVLAMLYEGARGMTAHEIGEALDLYNATSAKRSISRDRFSMILQSLQTSTDNYKIKMGTHAFIDKTAEVKLDYQCKLKNYYESNIVKVDFSNPAQATKEINNWAKSATEGHIQDLISESEAQSSTLMLLLNAVYFKGLWEIPFPAEQTADGPFYVSEQKTEKVPLMNVMDKFNYKDLPEFGAHIVQLPYKGNKFSMFVILPHSKTGLDAITKMLSPERSLSGVIGSLVPTKVNLIMPKFEFDYAIKLRPTLEKLGIQTMFSAEAELDDIAVPKSGSLKVSNVLQKAGISVTEAGTVAYAATAVDLGNKFGSEEIIDFKVDRPFLFFIEDTTTRTTVFVGKVTNPNKVKVVSSPQGPTGQKPGGTDGEPEVLDKFGPGHNIPSTPRPCKPISTTTDYISQGRLNFFDGQLLQKLASQEKGNFVVSPASIKTLLGLIMEGAEDTTLQELLEVLRLPTNDMNHARQLMCPLQNALQRTSNPHVTVDSATKAYISKDLQFNTSYVSAILDLYRAGTENLNFKEPESAAAKINTWVKKETRDNIPTLISADKIDPDTLTILVNTVFFDAKWKDEFLDKDVKKECFYSEQNHKDSLFVCNRVDMMYRKADLFYRYLNDFNSHVVQIPYKDERFSMVLVVPDKRDGSRKIITDLHHIVFPALLDKVRPNEVHLKLPKFTVEYSADLKNTLTQMGLNTVFSDEAKLPYMINKKQGQVSSLIHKAKIEVTQKGTTAASASGAVVVPLMSGSEAAHVTADHPFYYFIYDEKTKNVLFEGRISSLEGDIGIDENTPSPGNVYPLSGSGSANRPTDIDRPESLHSEPHPSTPPKTPQGSEGLQHEVSNYVYGKGTQQMSGQGDRINFPSEKESSLKPGSPGLQRSPSSTEKPGFFTKLFG